MMTKAPDQPSFRSDKKMPRELGQGQGNILIVAEEVSSNGPSGSRREPGTHLTAPILQLPPGQVPEGWARGVQDTVL